MNEHRIGLGVDLHRFADAQVATDRPLVLGGHIFPGARPLVGHSDADVVAHAIADGVLGAAGLGDLGMHFPDTDEAWHGADSLVILAACRELAAADGWQFVNGDCTVVADTPRLAPYTEAMSAKLSSVVGAPVSVKATRAEGLGALGRAEGVVCVAIVLLDSP